MPATKLIKSPTGMKAFTIIWIGQLISLMGSAMTWFAFTIWAWEKTGQASTLSTVSFFSYLPTVLFSPLAGVLVDRWNRKWVMALSDMATAMGTLAALLLYSFGALEIWHIFVISALAGFFTAFQYPAYTVAVTTLVPKEHYTRAESMLGLAQALPNILASVIAAALLKVVGMRGIMLIDLLTFVIALAALLWVAIPQPAESQAGTQSRGSLRQEIRFGFNYIRQRASLKGLLLVFVFCNLFIATGSTLLAPMILNGSGNNETTLAGVQSICALGGVAGGVLVSLWGGPRRRIHGILLGGAGACLGILWLGFGRQFPAWAAAGFIFYFFEPLIEGGNLSIWQSKVEADVQGKVLTARHLLVQIPYLLGMLASGPLAEYVLAPRFTGGDQGAAMSLLMIAAGILGGLGFLSGYCFRPIRDADSLLPDQPARITVDA